MSILLTTSVSLPDPSTYHLWCAVGTVKNLPDPSKKIPEIEALLETTFESIRNIWTDIARTLSQQDPQAELTHTATCNTNVSDFGTMLAWSHLIEIWLNKEERILVICDDPWVYRHLLALGVEVHSPPTGFRLLELVFFCRGYLARLKYAFSAAFAVIRLRKLKIAVKAGAPVLLVYGHPASDAEGHDAYFGDLMYREPEVRRMIHVDCSPGRALELSGDNRTASLHAWGSIFFAFVLPFVVWRPKLKLTEEKYRWLVRRARTLEGSAAQSSAIQWQMYCQKRWVESQPPRSIAWPWENHGWERALVRVARAAGVSLSGYQHTVVGLRHWVHLPQSNMDGRESLPERILCSSEVWRKMLINYGYESTNLVLVGAHRFPRVPEVTRDRAGPIFLALPFKHNLAVQMVAAARCLAAPDCRFLVKDHPMNPFPFDEEPWLTRTTEGFVGQTSLSLVVYAASTVGLEAMLAGIPVIRFVPSGSPTVDVIPEALAVKASTSDFLGNCIREITDSSTPVVEKNELFAPLDMKLWRDALGIRP